MATLSFECDFKKIGSDASPAAKTFKDALRSTLVTQGINAKCILSISLRQGSIIADIVVSNLEVKEKIVGLGQAGKVRISFSRSILIGKIPLTPQEIEEEAERQRKELEEKKRQQEEQRQFEIQRRREEERQRQLEEQQRQLEAQQRKVEEEKQRELQRQIEKERAEQRKIEEEKQQELERQRKKAEEEKIKEEQQKETARQAEEHRRLHEEQLEKQRQDEALQQQEREKQGAERAAATATTATAPPPGTSRPTSAKVATEAALSKLSGLGSMFSDMLGSMAKKEVRPGTAAEPKKSARPPLSPEDAAQKIQRAARIRRARKRVQLLRTNAQKVHRLAGQLLLWAAVSIQRIARGRLGRKRYRAIALMIKKQKEKKREACATKIQCVGRAWLARKRVVRLMEAREEERKLEEWAKYQKANKGGKKDPKAKKGGPDKGSSATAKSNAPTKDDDDDDEGSSLSKRALEEKIKRLEEIEESIKEREKNMLEANRLAEQRAAEMARALAQMEERVRIEAADQAARQQLLMMAAGPISNRSEFRTSGPMSNRSGGWAKASARGPPSARSAEGGSNIPKSAPRMNHDGEEWVQLWDPEEQASYWYCERTGAAQWEQPGTVSANDSGYESSGAMTDYSTDHETNYSSGGEDFGESEWQEYWDEQAQAKYWYNNSTGEATWTKPAQLPGSAANSARSSRSARGGNSGVGGGPTTSARNASDAGDWVSYLDDVSGQEYWYNAKTGESSWV